MTEQTSEGPSTHFSGSVAQRSYYISCFIVEDLDRSKACTSDDDDDVMRNQVALVQFGRYLVLEVRNSDLLQSKAYIR